jgi:hypothetical protein
MNYPSFARVGSRVEDIRLLDALYPGRPRGGMQPVPPLTFVRRAA